MSRFSTKWSWTYRFDDQKKASEYITNLYETNDWKEKTKYTFSFMGSLFGRLKNPRRKYKNTST